MRYHAASQARAACLLSLLCCAAGRRFAPRAALGSGGSVMFSSDTCAARYDASGVALPPSTPCDRCSAPWLEAVDANTSAKVCRCMASCKPALAGAAAAASAATARAAVLPHPSLPWDAAWDVQARRGRGVQLVIGLGTGRCGTVTLAQLLKAQPGCAGTFSHEQHPLLAWTQPSERAMLRAADGRVRQLLQRRLRSHAAASRDGADNDAAPTPLVGDVASFYLPYVETILSIEPGAKFVVLRRARAEVVASFLRKDPGVDLWRECADRSGWSSNSVYWAAAHPKFPCSGAGGARSAAEALGLYWDAYEERVARLTARFPDRVRVFASPAVFRNATAQADMLVWAGVPAPAVNEGMPKHNCGTDCTAARTRAKAAARRARRARARARRLRSA
jgi:hypothetical protein